MELRELDRVADWAAVEDLFLRAADYVELAEGVAPGAEQIADFFDEAPPGVDPASSLKLAAGDAPLDGIADLAFGYPQAEDAFLGLLLLAPEARGRGLGKAMLAGIEARARARGARRLLIGVLDENPRARAFWEREGFVWELTTEPRAIGARMHVLHRLVKALI